MSNLLNKEIKLALHPTCIIFLALVTMVMIPNYPYEVNYFYACLGIFFVCLNGRENKDIFYSILLPIRKKDIVKARFLLIIAIEFVQMLVTLPFILIRTLAYPIPNEVGLDANIALIGSALLLFGIFNLVFLTSYYKNVNKVGASFGYAAVIVFVYIAVAIILTHAVPVLRDYIDTPDPSYILIKLIMVFICLLGYLALTWISYKKSVRYFDVFDM